MWVVLILRAGVVRLLFPVLLFSWRGVAVQLVLEAYLDAGFQWQRCVVLVGSDGSVAISRLASHLKRWYGSFWMPSFDQNGARMSFFLGKAVRRFVSSGEGVSQDIHGPCTLASIQTIRSSKLPTFSPNIMLIHLFIDPAPPRPPYNSRSAPPPLPLLLRRILPPAKPAAISPQHIGPRMREVAAEPPRVHEIRITAEVRQRAVDAQPPAGGRRRAPRGRARAVGGSPAGAAALNFLQRKARTSAVAARAGRVDGAVVVIVVRGVADFDDLDEFAEDGEFELELDAVDDAFEGGFDQVQVCEFGGQERDVHDYDDDVDGQGLVHGFADGGVAELGGAVFEGAHVVLDGFAEAKESDCLADVDDGEDGFLDEEADHLDFLEDGVPVDEVLEGGWFEVVGV